jgi:hypothetical protein
LGSKNRLIWWAAHVWRLAISAWMRITSRYMGRHCPRWLHCSCAGICMNSHLL